MSTEPDPIPDTFVKIAHMLQALSWEERRRVLNGINAFFDPRYDREPTPQASSAPGHAAGEKR